MKQILLLAILVLSSCTNPYNMQNSWTITSPDGKLALKMNLNPSDGTLNYSIGKEKDGRFVSLIEPSKLGLVVDTSYLTWGFKWKNDTEFDKQTESYNLKSGKSLSIADTYQGQAISFDHPSGLQMAIEIRVFNNGAAFRYKLNNTKEAVVKEEASTFKLPSGKAWLQPYDEVTKWTPAYEKPFMNGIGIGTTSTHKEGWCFPALFEVGSHWLLLTESGMDGNYPGTHLKAQVPDNNYSIQFPIETEATGNGHYTAHIPANWVSPWRIIQVGDNAGDIISSQLVHTLAAPSKIANTDWIMPGRVSWSWWSDHNSPQNPEELKKFIDLAAEMTWEYSLIDANWNLIDPEAFQEVLAYGREKGIGLWLWYNSGGPHNTVEEQPRDLMHLRDARRAEFEKISQWGVKGVKIDFFQSDKQHIMQQYIDILEDAADFNIMVNFHGCTIPRGWSRTYPHLLTMEAVRGAETYSFNGDWPVQAPVQNTIYPFTRNAIGSMDYTPVTFSNQTFPHITTLAHELALSVVFESGAQHFADRVAAYQQLPAEVKGFLQNVPAAWDETLLLDGYPGELVVIARRSGDKWYIGGINGSATEKAVNLQFTNNIAFKNGQLIIDDGHGGFVAQQFEKGRISLTMKPFGGFVVGEK